MASPSYTMISRPSLGAVSMGIHPLFSLISSPFSIDNASHTRNLYSLYFLAMHPTLHPPYPQPEASPPSRAPLNLALSVVRSSWSDSSSSPLPLCVRNFLRSQSPQEWPRIGRDVMVGTLYVRAIKTPTTRLHLAFLWALVAASTQDKTRKAFRRSWRSRCTGAGRAPWLCRRGTGRGGHLAALFVRPTDIGPRPRLSSITRLHWS